MKYAEAIKIVINEERNGGDFGEFHIELGENEGENIPHFHLDNQETSSSKKKKSAILKIRKKKGMYARSYMYGEGMIIR